MFVTKYDDYARLLNPTLVRVPLWMNLDFSLQINFRILVGLKKDKVKEKSPHEMNITYTVLGIPYGFYYNFEVCWYFLSLITFVLVNLDPYVKQCGATLKQLEAMRSNLVIYLFIFLLSHWFEFFADDRNCFFLRMSNLIDFLIH